MLTTVRQIGNSKGVLIPAAFLASCQIEDQADMQLQDGQIVIKPTTKQLRKNWFSQPEPATSASSAKAIADANLWTELPLADDSEWVW